MVAQALRLTLGVCIMFVGGSIFMGGELAQAQTPYMAHTGDVAAPTIGLDRHVVQATVTAKMLGLPLQFEANHGQVDTPVKFLARGQGYTLFLTPTESVVVLQQREATEPTDSTDPLAMREPAQIKQSVVRMRLEGANPSPAIEGREQLPGIVNYFIGDDPAKWRTHIPTYAKVHYKEAYPGIDLAYYGNQGKLEYDFIVAPGADPTQIKLAFEGAEKIKVDPASGDLVLVLSEPSAISDQSSAHADTPVTFRVQKPIVYQLNDNGHKMLVAGQYVLLAVGAKSSTPALSVSHQPAAMSQSVAIQLAAYDRAKPLVIDPVLSWATYLNSAHDEYGQGIVVDAAGDVYVTGRTNFRITGLTASSFQSVNSSSPPFHDAFVTKINAAGTAILYSTLVGGTGDDGGFGIAVDTAGRAYIIGTTSTTDSGFPGTGASTIQSMSGGMRDVFVTKINESGSALLYSTYLGGTNDDFGSGIAIDNAGNAYVTGLTFSSGFPGTSTSPIKSTPFAGANAFVTKIDATGSQILYSTYLAGTGGGHNKGISVDTAGNAYVTGVSSPGSGFTGVTGSSIQSLYGGGPFDVTVTKIKHDGSLILYSTFLGGSGADETRAIAVDSLGNAYIVGVTNTPSGFPGTSTSLIQATNNGQRDAFLTKINSAGSAIVYSTYLGGTGDDEAFGVTVDAAGNAFVVGRTCSPGFPGTSTSSIQSTFLGTMGTFAGGCVAKAFVTKVHADASSLAYSTYLGSTDLTPFSGDFATAVVVDATGNLYVTGASHGPGFPGTSTSQIVSTYVSLWDAFVAKIIDFIPVTIDIKPGSFPNSVNLGSGGTVPVAILSTGTFDATTVDPTTVTLASAPVKLKGKGTPMASHEDVNGDGLPDLVVHVSTEAFQLSESDTKAVLEGLIGGGGLSIRGTDTIRVVP